MKPLIGHQISQSPAIQQTIDGLVSEVGRLNSELNSVRPPQKEWAESSKKLVDQTGRFRGRPLLYPYVGTGSGNGVFVEIEDGSVKMDLINGIGVHILGHSHSEVIRASLVGALSDIVNQGNLQANRDYLELGSKLVELASRKSRLAHAWLSTCGSIANENALKMARQKNSPARLVVSMANAFAGRTTMMAEITDNPAYKQGLPEYNEVLRIPFYDRNNPRSGEESLARLKEHVSKHEKNICAFVFEPILGEGGYRVPPREFFIPLLEFCKEKGIAVWVDEVQTFMRTGDFFAFEHFDFGKYVDIVSLAKTAQVGATLFTEEYNPQPGLIAGTFAGTTGALRAGLAIIEVLEKGPFLGEQGRIREIEKRFCQGLNALAEGAGKGMVSEVEGCGLMVAFTPHDGSKEKQGEVLKALYKNGIITLGCGRGPFRIRFLIPAIISDAQIQEALKIIELSLKETA